ncbi:hypothetical protein [Oceanisphaera sp. KMM 10153]|uniref:hypothetical protein n=1 Tax=Oceanisphaera submarina TaxID=3390193 RepID=UPI003975D2CD
MHSDEPHVSLKSVVDGLSLSWPAQYRKIKSDMRKFGCCLIATPSKSGLRGSN